MKKLTAAALTAAAFALGSTGALAQTPMTSDKHDGRAASGSAANNAGRNAAPSGYPGSTTEAGAQNQPRNGGATGSAGKRPSDGRASVHPESNAHPHAAPKPKQ